MPLAVELDPSAVLTGGAPAPAPLLLLLHGFGSDERDLPGLTAHLPARLGWASLPGPFPASPYPEFTSDEAMQHGAVLADFDYEVNS